MTIADWTLWGVLAVNGAFYAYNVLMLKRMRRLQAVLLNLCCHAWLLRMWPLMSIYTAGVEDQIREIQAKRDRSS